MDGDEASDGDSDDDVDNNTNNYPPILESGPAMPYPLNRDDLEHFSIDPASILRRDPIQSIDDELDIDDDILDDDLSLEDVCADDNSGSEAENQLNEEADGDF